MMDGMDDLIAFLNARLDEDEQIAREAGGKYESGQRWWEDGRFGNDGTVGDERGSVVVYRTGVGRQHSAHIARHDPARVLAETEARRKLLTEYEEVLHNEGADYEWAGGWASGLGKAVAFLALPYADHPDYRDTWRP